MPTITPSDFSISAGGDLRSAAGSTVYDVLDLHAWLQDLADNAGPTADDNVSILGANPSELAGKRNTARPMALTLLGALNIDDATSQRFRFGSIEQAAGAVLYTGVNTIGAGLTGRSHYVVQNGAKYNSGTKWWPAGPPRALFKVRTGGAFIDSGLLTVYSREWGYSFSHFDVDCSPGGEQVAALSVAADANITRLTGNYTGGSNTVTSTTPGFTVTVTLGDTNQTLGTSGSKLYKGTISWTGGARLAEVWQALQWLCHESSNGTIGGVPGWRYRKLNAAYTDVLAAPFGVLAGGRWFVAQGWWINPASLNALDLQAYQLISHDGTTVVPPVAVAVSVGGLVVGDYVLVGKDNGSGGFNVTTGITATGTAAATTVTLSGAPASDVPTGSGYIRINGNPHTYTGIFGTTVSGLSPAVPAGGYSGASVWFPLVDTVADTTSESSGTFTYGSDFTARVRVRNGGGSPIVPFETTFAVTSGGGTINAIRAADA
jgi:hypothetical protein